jgi:magnesium transporter
LQKLATTLPDDLAADMIQSLEPDVAKAVVAGLAPGARRRLEALAAYPPDSAAGRMTGQVFAIPESQTVAQTIVALRRRRPQAHRPFYTYVTDAAGRLTGIVSFNTLLFAEPDGSIADLMIEATSVAAETCRRPGRR